jgi:hypothetical protein
MGNWDSYQREEREPQNKVTGKQRCVIVDVEETTTKSSGLPMIVVTVKPSGCNFKVKNYIVKNEYFNRNMTAFFDAFPEITDGDFNFLGWVGCEGAAMFAEDDRGYLTVKYFISPERAADLPPFEGDKPERQTISSLDDAEDDGELPFV